MAENGPAAEPATGPPAPFAWAVHILTGSGAVLALLALMAIEEQRWTLALIWLFVALVVDGIDGSLARWARVKERAARIDGDSLDLVVDFLTYVFVPTVFIARAGLVPAGLAVWLSVAILVSSLYLFARSDMKTKDGYFRGFPALWNLVAFYLYVVQPGETAGAIAVGGLVLLTFVPVLFAHPFRVRDYGIWLPLLALAWAVSTMALLWTGWTEPVRRSWLAASLGTGGAMVALGLLRTVRGPRSAL